MKFNPLYEYPILEKVTAESGFRYYVDPVTLEKLASVTTILNATSQKPELEAWRAHVGETKANAVIKEATNLGTLLHTHLECYIQDLPRPSGSNLIRQLATRMGDTIINRSMHQVTEVWGMEKQLYMPGLYAGTSDLIGLWNGVPAIIDYKTTKKMKTADQIQDYFAQGAAYCMAHDELFNTNITTIVILMVSRELEFKEFIIEGSDFFKAKEYWMEKLETYYK